MLSLPNNVYVIENNKKFFGCTKRQSSTVFTFTSKFDAMEVRSNMVKYNMVHRQKNNTYLMRKSDNIALLRRPQKSVGGTEIYQIDFIEFCTLVSLNNVDVSIISNIEHNEKGITMHVAQETKANIDHDIMVEILDGLYESS